MEWKRIYPDKNNDWINKRNQNFNKFTSIFPEEKGDLKSTPVIKMSEDESSQNVIEQQNEKTIQDFILLRECFAPAT